MSAPNTTRHTLATMALLAAAATASAAPLVMPLPTAYASATDAATTTLRTILAQHDRRENAGAIVRAADGSYHATSAIRGDVDTAQAYRVALPAGAVLVAVWHTHPSGGAPDELVAYFTAQDIAAATALHVPSFIGVQADGTVRMFEPGTTHTERLRGHTVSAGVVIAHKGDTP